MFDIKGSIVSLLMIFLLVVLLFTWFFPTINGSTAVNNTSTLWLGGTNYNWVVPVLFIVIIIGIILVILGIL